MLDPARIFLIIRRWAWLLVIGAIVAGLVGYFVSSSQTAVYEASTKLLVSNELQGKQSDFGGLSNQQLVLTYVELLKTKHLREAASVKAGIDIRAGQLTIQQVEDTQIIEIRAEATDPEDAATIAKAMASTLIEETDAVRKQQFSTSEDNLTKRIEQVKQQIVDYQNEYDQAYQRIYESQLAQINEQITGIQAEISTLEIDIVKLSSFPTQDNRAQVADKEARVTQLQSSFKLYDELRANLIVLGKPAPSSQAEEDPQLQQLKATIALYQKMYIDLLSSLEATRLARLQQTPNILQIQEAYAPNGPVNSSPMQYAILSGLAGMILAAMIVLLWEYLRENIRLPERPTVISAKKISDKKTG